MGLGIRRRGNPTLGSVSTGALRGARGVLACPQTPWHAGRGLGVV